MVNTCSAHHTHTHTHTHTLSIQRVRISPFGSHDNETPHTDTDQLVLEHKKRLP